MCSSVAVCRCVCVRPRLCMYSGIIYAVVQWLARPQGTTMNKWLASKWHFETFCLLLLLLIMPRRLPLHYFVANIESKKKEESRKPSVDIFEVVVSGHIFLYVLLRYSKTFLRLTLSIGLCALMISLQFILHNTKWCRARENTSSLFDGQQGAKERNDFPLKQKTHKRTNEKKICKMKRKTRNEYKERSNIVRNTRCIRNSFHSRLCCLFWISFYVVFEQKVAVVYLWLLGTPLGTASKCSWDKIVCVCLCVCACAACRQWKFA